MLDIGKLITLDNDLEFIISGRASYNDQVYYMLSNAKNFYDMRVGYLTMEGENLKVNIVDESSGINMVELIQLLSKSAQEYLENIDLSTLTDEETTEN